MKRIYRTVPLLLILWAREISDAARAIPVPACKEKASFWMLMKQGEFLKAGRDASTPDGRELAGICQDLWNAQPSGLTDRLLKLSCQTGDKKIRQIAGDLLGEIFFYREQWEDFVRFRDLYSKRNRIDIPLAESFCAQQRKTLPEMDGDIHWPLGKSRLGTPVIMADINGCRVESWLDTGAGLCVLTETFARTAGVLADRKHATTVSTATDRPANAFPALINRLKIGALEIGQVPALIIPDGNLSWKMPGEKEPVVIPAIIGWNILKEFRITMDIRGGSLVMGRSSARSPENSRLSWFGYPVLQAESEEGKILLFGLDTGAQSSAITDGIFKKCRFPNVRQVHYQIYSAGGKQLREGRRVEDLKFILDGEKISLPGIATQPFQSFIMLEADGVLGADLLKTGTLTLDARAGVIRLLPYKEGGNRE